MCKQCCYDSNSCTSFSDEGQTHQVWSVADFLPSLFDKIDVIDSVSCCSFHQEVKLVRYCDSYLGSLLSDVEL